VTATGHLRAPIPVGWFKVAMPEEVAIGEVLVRRFFGTQLVLWRDANGDVTCQDAYCPHTGASMAVGATLADGCIECPFHSWRFDAQGWNRRRFFSTTPGSRARLRTFPVRVAGGIVFAWHHPYGDAPTWEHPEVPELRSPGHRPFVVLERTVELRPEPPVAVSRFDHPVEGTLVVTSTPIDRETALRSWHVAVEVPLA
jgi:phenylpropionate dioxygenase-like ring-hydroxylating dioxygenase large terminal subunit